VPGLTGVSKIVNGGSTTYAVLTNGTVQSWGLNRWGRLGGQWSPPDVPTQIPGLTGVMTIGSGLNTAYAVS
jgi:hypothetical protein